MEKDISRFQIWRRIINRLNKEKIEYLLVGGAALVIHGLPRSTLDIDIYVPAKEDTLIKLFSLAESLGLKSQEKDILKFSHSPQLYANQWICFSYKTQDVLDVFFANEADFHKLYRHSQLKQDKNLKVRVAALDDIAAMKKASGRAIDLSDFNFIKESKKSKK